MNGVGASLIVLEAGSGDPAELRQAGEVLKHRRSECRTTEISLVDRIGPFPVRLSACALADGGLAVALPSRSSVQPGGHFEPVVHQLMTRINALAHFAECRLIRALIPLTEESAGRFACRTGMVDQLEQVGFQSAGRVLRWKRTADSGDSAGHLNEDVRVAPLSRHDFEGMVSGSGDRELLQLVASIASDSDDLPGIPAATPDELAAVWLSLENDHYIPGTEPANLRYLSGCLARDRFSGSPVGVIVGTTAEGSAQGGSVTVEYLGVSGTVRRRGIGSLLLRQFLSVGNSAEAASRRPAAVVCSDFDNAAATAFYRSHGFQEDQLYAVMWRAPENPGLE